MLHEIQNLEVLKKLQTQPKLLLYNKNYVSAKQTTIYIYRV